MIEAALPRIPDVSATRELRVVATGIVGLGLACVSLAVALDGHRRLPGFAVVNALSVALPIGVGGYVWNRRPAKRLGSLLAMLGVGFFLVALSASRNQVVYSVGRVASFVVAALVVYVILAFPSGRLESRGARFIAGAAVLLVCLLYLPSVPLVRSFPHPFPWGGCDAGCPHNAFFAGHQPGFVSVVVPLRELLACVVIAAAVVLVALRIRAASRLGRRMLVPVLAVSTVWMLGLIALYAARRAHAAAVVDVASWTLLVSIPLIALGLLFGILQWRVYAGTALSGLIRRLASHPEPHKLRDAMAETLEDPSLEIVYWVSSMDRFADADGHPVTLPATHSNRSVTPVTDGDEPIAAIVHDPALREQPELVDAAASAAIMVLDHHRLAAQLRASIRELRGSQTRILTAADAERQKIERDLHDGAQQRLVALRIKLEVQRELIERDPARAAALQSQLGETLDAALDEIRELARGIYPPLLASHGLGDALEAVALGSPVPTTVRMGKDRRFSREIESTVYFCCREALQNVAKHAPGATSASIVVSADTRTLTFEVANDGPGFDTERAAPGGGLTNIRDRLSVVGGALVIRSGAGAGTTVVGSIPLAARNRPR